VICQAQLSAADQIKSAVYEVSEFSAAEGVIPGWEFQRSMASRVMERCFFHIGEPGQFRRRLVFSDANRLRQRPIRDYGNPIHAEPVNCANLEFEEAESLRYVGMKRGVALISRRERHIPNLGRAFAPLHWFVRCLQQTVESGITVPRTWEAAGSGKPKRYREARGGDSHRLRNERGRSRRGSVSSMREQKLLVQTQINAEGGRSIVRTDDIIRTVAVGKIGDHDSGGRDRELAGEIQ